MNDLSDQDAELDHGSGSTAAQDIEVIVDALAWGTVTPLDRDEIAELLITGTPGEAFFQAMEEAARDDDEDPDTDLLEALIDYCGRHMDSGSDGINPFSRIHAYADATLTFASPDYRGTEFGERLLTKRFMVEELDLNIPTSFIHHRMCSEGDFTTAVLMSFAAMHQVDFTGEALDYLHSLIGTRFIESDYSGLGD
ncbi:hypothetical protein ACWG8W_06155 [Citricoccus zhacaiensis]